LTGEKATEPRRSFVHRVSNVVNSTSVAARSSSTEHGGQGLGGIEELGRGDGIAILGVDWDRGEGRLEGVEVGASFGDLGGSSHGVWWIG